MFRENGLALYADPRNAAELGRHNTLSGYLKSHFGRVHGGTKRAITWRCWPISSATSAHTQALTGMRTRIRDKTRAATCLGFGPRFQHSTGQAYKGGPNSGVFLQITCDDPADIDVPGHSYSFGVVKAAQASGDLDVLVRTRPPRAARPSQGCRCGIGGAGPRNRCGARIAEFLQGVKQMQIGMIGLGRMGGNMSRRLMKAGHHCVVFDANRQAARGAGKGRRHGRRVACGCGEDARGKAARRLADVAGGPGHRRDGRAARRPAGAGTTSSSTAAIPSTRTTSAAPKSWPRRASATSIAARPAASGASSAAIA